jgi:hypothetical protein
MTHHLIDPDRLTPDVLDAVRVLVLQQPKRDAIDSGLVDVVALLLDGVTTRDLDAIADDIVCLVLQFDDLVRLVRERLDVQQAFRERAYPGTPAADPHIAAETIIKALHAVVRPRLSKGREL